ncbi:15273_t:CDS:10, partial [Cetraspora pellucida]
LQMLIAVDRHKHPNIIQFYGVTKETVLEDIKNVQPSNSLRLKRQRTLSFLKKVFASSDNLTKDIQTHKDDLYMSNDEMVWGCSKTNYEKAIKTGDSQFRIKDIEVFQYSPIEPNRNALEAEENIWAISSMPYPIDIMGLPYMMNNNDQILNEDVNRDPAIDESNNSDLVPGEDIPPITRERIISAFSGLGFNINNIIGAGIFVTPTSIWKLVQSPGKALILWIVGGLISLFGSMIYVELGLKFPRGSGEQKYLEETFEGHNFGHIFSFVMITIILPGAIIADSYASSTYLLYAIKGKYGDVDKYFGIDYIESRFTAIAILLIITAYHMYSNKLAIKINNAFAIIKFSILIIISIVGLIMLKETDSKNHWTDIFNNIKSEDAPILQQIGNYVNAMLKELKTPANALMPESQKLKYSTISSVIISLILYPLTQIAFITVVDPKQAIPPDESIAIVFGRTILGEPGRIIISLFILISSCGCVGSLVFM